MGPSYVFFLSLVLFRTVPLLQTWDHLSPNEADSDSTGGKRQLGEWAMCHGVMEMEVPLFFSFLIR